MTSTQSSSALELIPQAIRAVDDRVRAIPADRWSARSPCEQWRARDVVNHLTAEHLWAADLLAGMSLQDVGDRYDGDVLGDDPVAAWDRASAASLAAWQRAAPDQEVELSRGRTPAAAYAEEMLLDLVVHGWDLARAAGLDERMPDAPVRHVLAFVQAHEAELDGAGVFAPPVTVQSQDPQDQLLGRLGRHP